MLEEIMSSRLGEKYYRYTHSSGVTVLLYPMKGYSTITAQFSVKFGSIDNCCSIDGGAPVRIPDGTAHYLEHKLFESPEKEAFARFAETGASCNAGTSYDSTRYYFSCSANFEKNLEILLDFVQHPYFTPENVEKERGIITQEITMYLDSPAWRVCMELYRDMFRNNPVRNDIAGSAESIALITDKLLYDVYDAYYDPSNMYLCIAGGFDLESAVEVCERCLLTRTGKNVVSIFEQEPPEVFTRRSEMNVPPSKKAHLTVATDEGHVFALGVPFLKKMAYASDVTIVPADQAPEAAGMVCVVTHVAQMFIPLGELVDLEKEKARVEKELKKNSAELDKLNAKLANPGFVNKAPAHVVEAERERSVKLSELVSKLTEQLKSM